MLNKYKLNDPVIVNGGDWSGYSGTIENINRTGDAFAYVVRLHFTNTLVEFDEGMLNDWRDSKSVVKEWSKGDCGDCDGECGCQNGSADFVIDMITNAPTREPNKHVDLTPTGIALAWWGDDWGPRIKMATVDRFLDWMVSAMKRRGML